LSYLLDTDHITILQRQAEPEFAAIMVHIALHPPSELAFSIISLHESINCLSHMGDFLLITMTGGVALQRFFPLYGT
jgi:hypothetical protein